LFETAPDGSQIKIDQDKIKKDIEEREERRNNEGERIIEFENLFNCIKGKYLEIIEALEIIKVTINEALVKERFVALIGEPKIEEPIEEDTESEIENTESEESKTESDESITESNEPEPEESATESRILEENTETVDDTNTILPSSKNLTSTNSQLLKDIDNKIKIVNEIVNSNETILSYWSNRHKLNKSLKKSEDAKDTVANQMIELNQKIKELDESKQDFEKRLTNLLELSQSKQKQEIQLIKLKKQQITDKISIDQILHQIKVIFVTYDESNNETPEMSEPVTIIPRTSSISYAPLNAVSRAGKANAIVIFADDMQVGISASIGDTTTVELNFKERKVIKLDSIDYKDIVNG